MTQQNQQRQCKCGNDLGKPFVDSNGRVLYQPTLCHRCQSIKGDIEMRRRLRMNSAAIIRAKIRNTLPPAFQKAHLRNLNPVFRKQLLSYDPTIGLVLYGPVGTGKSFSTSALGRYLITQGHIVRRVTYEGLCLQIRHSYKSDTQTELDIIQPLINCDALIIEDIGGNKSIGEPESDFSLRTLFIILDSRLEQRRPTFISTNKTQKNLALSFDERIESRLSLFKWLGCGGVDKRRNSNGWGKTQKT